MSRLVVWALLGPTSLEKTPASDTVQSAPVDAAATASDPAAMLPFPAALLVSPYPAPMYAWVLREMTLNPIETPTPTLADACTTPPVSPIRTRSSLASTASGPRLSIEAVASMWARVVLLMTPTENAPAIPRLLPLPPAWLKSNMKVGVWADTVRPLTTRL